MYLSNFIFPNLSNRTYFSKNLGLKYLFFLLTRMNYYFCVNWFKKTFSFLSLHRISFISSYIFSFAWRHVFFNFLRGFVRPFRARIKLIGLRYRILSVQKMTAAIWLNIGLSHFFKLDFERSYFFMSRAQKKGKYALQFFNLDVYGLGQFLFLLRRFRGPNIFTGNGLKILKEKLTLKKRKKSK